MKNKIFLVIFALTIMLFIASCDDDPASPEGKAEVRVIHTSYDAPAVDVWVEEEVAVSDLGYGESSGYAEVEDGMNQVMVVPAGATEPVVIDVELDLVTDADYTVLAVGDLNNIEPIFTQDARGAVSDAAKVRFIHASPDAPAVDIKYDIERATPVFENKAFKDISDYLQVPEATYEFMVTPAGSNDIVVSYEPVMLENGNVYTIVAHGTLDENDDYPFGVRVFIDNGSGVNYVDLTTELVYTDIAVDDAYDLINNNPEIFIIDVSNMWEYGHIPGALDVPLGDGSFEAAIPTWDPNAMYLIYCHGDAPSMQAAQMLVDAGFMNVYRLEGNYGAWVAAGYDIEIETYMDISAADLYQMMMDDPDLIVIDVSPMYENGHIPGSVNYPVGDGMLDYALEYLDPMANYAVYCHGDAPSMQGAQAMIDAGFMYVYRLEGNYDAWVNAGYDVEVGVSKVTIVHASPDAPEVWALVDLVNLGAGLAFPEYFTNVTFNPGIRNVKIDVAGTSNTVIEADLEFLPEMNYSLFAVNEVANIEPLFIVDDLTPPAAGNAHVRFIHLSPDAPAVDITLTDGTVLFGDYEFKEYSDFTPFSANTYDLQVRAAGTSTVVLDLPGVMLEDGIIYTVFAKGFLAGTGVQELGAVIIENN